MAYIKQIRKEDVNNNFRESWEGFNPGDTMQLNLKGLTAIYNNAVVTFSAKKGNIGQPITTPNVLPAFINTGNLTQVLPANVTTGEIILSLIPTQTANFERLSSYVLELQFLLTNATVESWQIIVRTGQDIVANVIPAAPAVNSMVFLGNFATAPMIANNGDIYYDTNLAEYRIYNSTWQALGGGGAVDSVNGEVGVVVLNQDDILDGANYVQYSIADRAKLASITAIFTTALKTLYDTASDWVATNGSNVLAHVVSVSNPHSVTKTQVGLSNADNTTDLAKPISTATQTALNTKEFKNTVTVGPTNADFITDGTDDQAQIQSAINSLTAGRTWNEKVILKGNLNVGASVTVPSFTTIEVLGNVTFNASWNPATTAFTGFWDITNGNTTVVNSVHVTGGKYTGQAFSAYPTRDTGNREYICVIHGIRSVTNSYFGNFISENTGSPITLEKLGANNGLPSFNLTIENIKIKDNWVGVQTYCNGYSYHGVNVNNITFENVEDDVVAIIGSAGGISGAGGIVTNANVSNIAGAKNGNTGAVIKIDAGVTTIGKGAFTDINISNVTSKTTGSGESLISFFQGDNPLSRNVQATNIVSEGSFLRGLFLQSSFRGVIFSNFVLEATHNIQLQSTVAPNNEQSVKFIGGVCKSATSTDAGDGVVYSAGTGAQGIRNVKFQNVDFLDKIRPINEGSIIPVGTGVQGVYNNLYYDVDLRDKTLSDCVFTATTSIRRIYQNGEFISDDVDLRRKVYIDNSIASGLLREYTDRAITATVTPTNYNRSTLNRKLEDIIFWSRKYPDYFLSAKSSTFASLTATLIASGTNNTNSVFTGSAGSVSTMTSTDSVAGLVIDQPATVSGTHGIDTNYSPNGFDAGFTASLWFRPANTAGAKRLISWNTASEARIDFLLSGTTLIGRACQTNAIYIGRSRASIITVTWQKLTMTYDGSGLASGVKLYRNGVLIDNADSNAGTVTGIPAASTDSIPLLAFSTNTQANPATGQADLVEIIAGVARTANEELQLYNAQRPRFGV